MVKIPITCITYADKSAWLDRAIELLRIEHNIIGKWWQHGITLEEYQSLRAWVQQRIDYKETKISENTFKQYLDIRYDPLSDLLISKKLQLKKLLANSKRFSPNIDDDIII